MERDYQIMKIMIASDIHGSEYYCRKLINRYHEEKPDKLLLLGDILYHGPRNELSQEYEPMKVAEILNSLKDKLLVVKGNCDAEVDEMISEFKFTTLFTCFFHYFVNRNRFSPRFFTFISCLHKCKYLYCFFRINWNFTCVEIVYYFF